MTPLWQQVAEAMNPLSAVDAVKRDVKLAGASDGSEEQVNQALGNKPAATAPLPAAAPTAEPAAGTTAQGLGPSAPPVSNGVLGGVGGVNPPPDDKGLNPVSSAPLTGDNAIAKPTDTLSPDGAPKPINWGGALQDFGKNIQNMNHGGYNTIFGEVGKGQAVAPVQAPKIQMQAPMGGITAPQIPQVAPPPPLAPPPVASDRRLKTNVSQSTDKLYAFLNALQRSGS